MNLSRPIFVTLLIIFIVLKLPAISNISFWDEPTYIVDLLNNSWRMFIPGSNEAYSYTPHIFGYSFLLFLGKSIIGSSILSLRIIALINFLFLLFGFYKLSQKYSRKFAVLTPFFICLIPIVFTYSTLILPDLFILSFGIWMWNFYLKERFKSFCLFALLSSVIFEPILAFVIPILIYELVNTFKTKNFTRLAYTGFSTLSLLISYLIYRFFTSGRFLHHNTLDEKKIDSISWFSITPHKLEVLKDMLISICHQSLVPILTLVIIYVLNIKFKRVNENEKKIFIFSIITSLSFIIFWFSFDEFHPRNLMSIYALIILNLSIHLFKFKKRVIVFTTSILVLFSVYQNIYFSKWQTPDAQYKIYNNSITLVGNAFKYIQENQIQSISCNWPVCEHISNMAAEQDYSIEVHRFYQTEKILGEHSVSLPFQKTVIDNNFLEKLNKKASLKHKENLGNLELTIFQNETTF